MSLWSQVEESLLARTLEGQPLVRDVRAPDGAVAFTSGRVVDRALLDRAREQGLLEEVASATDIETSDTEIVDLLRLLKRHRKVPKGRPL